MFDGGDDLRGAAAGLADFDVDVEYAFETLCPSHGSMLIGGGSVSLVGGRGLAALAAPGGSRECPVLAVGGGDAVATGEVDAELGDEGRQPSNEIQRFEDHLVSAIAPRVL